MSILLDLSAIALSRPRMAAFFDDDDDGNTPDAFFTQTQTRIRREQAAKREINDRQSQRDQHRRASPQPDFVRRDSPQVQQEEAEFEFEGARAGFGNAVQSLATRWMNERSAPELLPNDPGGELEDCLQTLLRQQEAVNSLRADMDNWTDVEHLRLMLVQQDNERVKWLANSYLRCRLKKIEDHYLALMSDDEYRERLSNEESQYLERFNTLKTSYFTTLCLSTLPQKLRSMADQPAMVLQPDMNQAVYVCALQTCGPVRTHDGKLITLDKNSIHMLRYSVAKDLISSGEAYLI